MNKVWQILKVKGDQVWTVSKNSTVWEALNLLVDKQIGSLVVMDGDNIAGIFTERDYARRVGVKGIQPETIRVEEVMTKDLITVSLNQSVMECMELMTEKRIRHLPVFEEGRLVGLLSIGDVVKDIIEELQFMVDQLEKYITGLR
jgi:CBS domain-containing protein